MRAAIDHPAVSSRSSWGVGRPARSAPFGAVANASPTVRPLGAELGEPPYSPNRIFSALPR